MKIAAITDDGKTISQHFGRAPYYLVLTIEDGQITQTEMRDKLGHAHFSTEPHEDHSHEHRDQGHGFGPEAHDRHLRMSQSIADCEVLLCRGMGRGAYISIEQRGIRPILTDIADIQAAVQAYLDGKIVDHVDKLH